MIYLDFDPTGPGGGGRAYQATLTVASNEPSGNHVITVNVNVISPFVGCRDAGWLSWEGSRFFARSELDVNVAEQNDYRICRRLIKHW